MVSKGTGASLGIAIAKAYLIIDPVFDVKNTTVSDVKEEVALYEKALVQTQRQIAKIQRIVHDKMGPDKADIFTAHIQIANDPEIKKEIIHTIQTSRLNSAYVVTQVFDRYYQTFASMEDNYFKERAGDIYDITKRILSNILHVPLPDILGIKEPCIVVANDLTPSAMALLEKQYVKGVVTNYGGRTSHAAIMARSMEIPAVVGLTDITKKITTGQLIAINGENGEVEIAPTDINKWQQRIKDFARLKEEFKKYINVPSVTLDGHKVEVEGNIGKPVDAPLAVNHGAEGIGLFRSEFLYMDNDHWPTEDEQYQGYKKVLETFKDKTVVIRTLDIGGDKKLSYFIFPDEANPFLGWRAIRFCLAKPEIFKTQLRALARASLHGKLAIMFPMIATVDEFKQAKEFANKTFTELENQKQAISHNIQIGMMVEIPAAAVLIDQFAKYADFFSIGTNDLIQYTFACDRMSPEVAYLYQPNNPSLLRLVKSIIDHAHALKKPVAMCGEMAGDTISIPILLGLGLDNFSMSVTSIPKARMIINNLSYQECQILANDVLKLENSEQVETVIKNFLHAKQLIS